VVLVLGDSAGRRASYYIFYLTFLKLFLFEKAIPRGILIIPKKG
jgi:hypothetical protein